MKPFVDATIPFSLWKKFLLNAESQLVIWHFLPISPDLFLLVPCASQVVRFFFSDIRYVRRSQIFLFVLFLPPPFHMWCHQSERERGGGEGQNSETRSNGP